jgi:hypothetical protein
MSLPEVKQLDFHISNRCNLSCLRCNRYSKIPEEQYPTDRMLADIEIIGKTLSSGNVHVVGGEPLLHPELQVILQFIRLKMPLKHLGLLTNGTVPEKLTEGIARLLDNVHITVYPGITKPEAVSAIQARMKSLGKTCSVSPVADFCRLYDPAGVEPQHLWVRHASCFMRDCKEYRAGSLTRCSTAHAIARFTGYHQDCLPVEDTPEFAARVGPFMLDTAPLQACLFCHGATKSEKWRQEADMDRWLALNQLPSR